MNIEQLQQDFLDDEVWILTFGGAFRRANISAVKRTFTWVDDTA